MAYLQSILNVDIGKWFWRISQLFIDLKQGTVIYTAVNQFIVLTIQHIQTAIVADATDHRLAGCQMVQQVNNSHAHSGPSSAQYTPEDSTQFWLLVTFHLMLTAVLCKDHQYLQCIRYHGNLFFMTMLV